jgi:putative DNA primase/helicase
MIGWVSSGVSDRTLVRDLAWLILSSDFFARSAAGEIFCYERGVYVPGGEFLIRQRVKHLLLELSKAEKWTRKLAREVTEFILLDTPELEATPSSDFINLENGILDVRTGELRPHSPKVLSTIRIPIAFDAQSSCPRIDEFIGEVFPKDSTHLAWEILGDLVTPDRSIQKAVCLVGEGGNGKGVFAQLAVRFVGPNNVAHLSLQKIEKDRFAVAGLYQKLANICTDLPSERLEDISLFKAITGCDRITGEFKYQNAFQFTPFARLIFSANHLPTSRDASVAFFDRWLVIPFEKRFRGTSREIPRRTLDSNLSSSREISGALNRALPALRKIRWEARFTETPSTREQWKEFQRATNPLGLWLEAETIASGSALVAQDELHAAYALACDKANRPILTRQMFGRALRRLRPDLKEAQRTIGGSRRWVYLGIGMKNGLGESLSKREATPPTPRTGSLESLDREDSPIGDLGGSQSERETATEIAFLE